MDSPYSWVFHSTLAKKAAANWLLQSSNKLRNKEHLLKFTQPAINLINRNLYGTEDPHTYGDYLVEEIELNEMGWDTTYYNTISVIPIFCSNSEVPIPANFHPIPKYEREAENTDELYGKLPQRKDNDVLCPFCHLHFPSERQCNRHQKIHERRSAAHAMPAEEMELVTKDGSLLLTREEVCLSLDVICSMKLFAIIYRTRIVWKPPRSKCTSLLWWRCGNWKNTGLFVGTKNRGNVSL